MPAKWSLACSLRPGGPEGRKALVTEFALSQDGEFHKVTFRARYPDAGTKSVRQLSAEEREDYLREFGAALESFSFEPAMEGWADSETVTLALKSGRRSMEVAVSEFRGETNIEFRSRLAKLLPIDRQTDNFKNQRQPDPARRFGGVADAWSLHVALETGTPRLYKVDLEGSAWRTKRSPPDSPNGDREIGADSSPGQLRVQEFLPGTTTLRGESDAELNREEEQVLLERALMTLREFAFQAEDEAKAGDISVSMTLVAMCLAGGDGSRKLTIRQSGLTVAQFDRSFAADFVRLVNARLPEKNRIRWE